MCTRTALFLRAAASAVDMTPSRYGTMSNPRRHWKICCQHDQGSTAQLKPVQARAMNSSGQTLNISSPPKSGPCVNLECLGDQAGQSLGRAPEWGTHLLSEALLNPEHDLSHYAPCLQAHEDVYVVKMSISGQPSSIKLVVRDEEGPDGTSALNPDSMDLALKAGPSRRLVVESPASFECATRAVLPQLKVRVTDVAGNYTDEGSYEVPIAMYCCCWRGCCTLLPISNS